MKGGEREGQRWLKGWERLLEGLAGVGWLESDGRDRTCTGEGGAGV